MRIDIVTIFPEVFPGTLGVGVVARAFESGAIDLHVHDLRDWAEGKHRQVDDAQFGGAAGMVLKPEPLIRAVRQLRGEVSGTRSFLLSPQGRPFTQRVAEELSCEKAIVLVCGRYQGVDERAREEIGEELSVGDYVLSGGEVGALTVIEVIARLIPGVVGSPESLIGETFSGDGEPQFEPPLYTRPAEFDGKSVPDVLRGGDHAAIERWRQEHSNRQRQLRRPDLVRSVLPEEAHS